MANGMDSVNCFRELLGGALLTMASIKPACGVICGEENRPNHTLLPLPSGFLPLPAVDGGSLVLQGEGSAHHQSNVRPTS